ncbi:hypothetical protein [Gordonia sp. 'Campus']|uniref:hypothetical protein n=1 Tax=Gordonia sp. 'Campus' TaxID=2915824 RepID=UPI001EE4AC18|nr:hypothetical protein [Gordonia sp. 'Campus']
MTNGHGWGTPHSPEATRQFARPSYPVPPAAAPQPTPRYFTPPARPVVADDSAARGGPPVERRARTADLRTPDIRTTRIRPGTRSRPHTASRTDPAVVIAALVMLALAVAVVVGLVTT